MTRQVPIRLACGLLLAVLAAAGVSAQIPGQNVNMVAGLTWPGGDPFLQRQNEPSVAVSSRNPLHLLAGANDYRTVDLAGLPEGETADAWLGLFKSVNGGYTWQSNLIPGYRQDTSPEGLASPLRPYDAGADPVVRAATHGLFYYAGLAFNRGDTGTSAIFVARFIDRNNTEAADPIGYLGTSIVARGTAEEFVDKPALAVDLPGNFSNSGPGPRHRDGVRTCVVDGRPIPASPIYIAWTSFDRRTPRGASKRHDSRMTHDADEHLGERKAGDDEDDEEDEDEQEPGRPAEILRTHIFFARSLDCGQTWERPIRLTRGTGTRQSAAIAIDHRSGAIYVAWRQFAAGDLPDAILVARSRDGRHFEKAVRISRHFHPFDQGTTGTSFRTNAYPTMVVDHTGRVYVAWSARGFASINPDHERGDARVVLATSRDGRSWTEPSAVDDAPVPGHQVMPAMAYAAGKLQLVYYDLREDRSTLFEQFVDDADVINHLPVPRSRHTIDVRTAQADIGSQPEFTSYSATNPRESERASQYLRGSRPGSLVVEQLQIDPPNLPMYAQGSVPFFGDYIDVAARTFRPMKTADGDEFWTTNSGQGSEPIFHVVWTDNRDVRPPMDGNWKNYTPPNSDARNPDGTSVFDPTQRIGVCVPGQAGMRNANIYTARVTPELVVGSPTNSRRLDAVHQRSFVVFLQNATFEQAHYRLLLPVQPPGGHASFQQFGQLTTLDVTLLPRSSAARTVYVTSTDPQATIPVEIDEIVAPGGALVPDGNTGLVVLNPDIGNPDIGNPDIGNPDIGNRGILNPDIGNPDIGNPDIGNPDIGNIVVVNPDIGNPDIGNPDIGNPDIGNPDIGNPDIGNPDIGNSTMQDVTYTVTNTGNTATAYTLNLALNTTQVPEGIKLQVIVHRVYKTPVVDDQCDLKTLTQNQVIASVPNPTFDGSLDLGDPDVTNPDPRNITFWLLPGESIRVTIRVFDTKPGDGITFDASTDITPATVAQAVNAEDAEKGVTQPPIAVHPPRAVAVDDAAFTAERTPVTVNVLANDVNANGVTRVVNFNPPELAAISFIAETVVVPTTGLVYSGAGQSITVIDPAENAVVARIPVQVPAAGPFSLSRVNARTGVLYFRHQAASGAVLIALDVRPTSPSWHQVLPTPPLSGVVHSFAVDEERGLLYVAHGIDLPNPVGVLSVIDADRRSATFHQILRSASFPAGTRGLSVSVNTRTGKVYVGADAASGGVYVMDDGSSPPALTRIPGFGATSAVVNEAANLVYAIGPATGSEYHVTVIDGVTDTRLAQVTRAGSVPQGVSERLAVDPASGKVYVRTRDTLLIVDGRRGSPTFNTVLADLPVGRAPGGAVDVAIDHALGRVVTSSSLDLRTTIVDATTDAIVATIPAPQGTTDIAIDPVRHKAFAEVESSLVQEIDIASGTFEASVPVAAEASGVIVNPLTHRAYVGRTVRGTEIAVLSANGEIATVKGQPHTAGRLTFPARHEPTNRFFVLNSEANVAGTSRESGSMSVIDGATDEIIAILPTGNSPFGIDIDHATGRIYSAGLALPGTSHGTVTVLDANNLAALPVTADTSQVVARPGQFISYGRHVVVNPITGKVYFLVLAGSETTIAVLDPTTNIATPVASLSGLGFTNIIRIHPGLNRVYVGMQSPAGTTVHMLNGATDEVLASRVGGGGSGRHTAGYLAVNPNANRLYLADFNADTVSMLDADTLAVLAVTPVPDGPSAIALNVSANRVYVSSVNAKTITVLDGTTLSVLSSVRLPLAAAFIAVDEGESRIYTSTGNVGDQAGAMVITDVAGSLGGDLRVVSVTNGTHGGVDIVGHDSVRYTPQPGFSGADTFTYTFETQNGKATGQVRVTVTPVTERTVALDDVYSVTRGTQLVVPAPGVLANDAVIGGPGAAATLVAGPSGGSLKLNADGSFTYDANADFEGVDKFTYRIAEGSIFSDIATVSIVVLAPPTFAVTTTNDSGPGSLRETLLAANAQPGRDRITFNIPGPGPHTIRPASALPTITDSLEIDGTTQPGFAGSPLIELDGSLAGSGASGIDIRTPNSTVRGLVINRFNSIGIAVRPSATNTKIAGNYIGTDLTGTTALGNGLGVQLTGSNNTLGGTDAGSRNVISGNAQPGVFISGAGARDNLIQGNFIGTDVTGKLAIGNLNGVTVANASGNTIGGTEPGAGNIISGNRTPGIFLSAGAQANLVQGNFIGTDVTGTARIGNVNGLNITGGSGNTIGGTMSGARNVIAGNNSNGIAIIGADSSANVIQGNLIGTDVSGTVALGNTDTGINLFRAPNNMIGGTTPAARNVISGNVQSDVSITGAGASGNLIQGNFIGTDVTGTAALSNTEWRIRLIDAPNNTIGGSTAAARNVISGGWRTGTNNGSGVLIAFAGSTGNVIQGNFIGTDVSGKLAIGNFQGVSILNASGNTIGGTEPGAGNLISGNQNGEINLFFGARTNVVQGNFIGTDVTGTSRLGTYQGVIIYGPGNTIGGTTPGARNVIAGNNFSAIQINGPDASANIIQGNVLGTDVTGTVALGNTQSGIGIANAPNNIIGGTTPAARNVISGNAQPGIVISGAGATGNLIQGNFIGTDVTGSGALGNTHTGISLFDAPNNIIGGTTPAARNVISGNAQSGILITGSGASGNLVQGNFIGTDVTGTVKLGNEMFGVSLSAPGNTVGGTTMGAGNLISGNRFGGVDIGESASTENVVEGNRIGTNVTGTAALGNGVNGVQLHRGASNNRIGGLTTAARNIISGNGGDGVHITSPTSTGNLVQGNFIGTNAAGNEPLGNGGVVVAITNSPGNLIGGAAVGAGNIIAASRFQGVLIQGDASSRNLVQGNFIGTNASGTTGLGNGSAGIVITSTVTGNAIRSNVVSGNQQGGVIIVAPATANAILSNAISGNVGLGIDLGWNGVTPNDPGDIDTGPNNLQNFPVLTSATITTSTTIRGSLNAAPNTTFTVEFFASPVCHLSGNGEGAAFVGGSDVTTDANGNVNFAITVDPTVAVGDVMTATATDPGGNTSEFSNCVTVLPSGTPRIAFSPATVTFGEVVQGRASEPQVVTITNTGEMPLELGFFSSNNSDFQVENLDCPLRPVPNPGALPPGASCRISARFSPALTYVVGARSGGLIVPSNSGSRDGFLPTLDEIPVTGTAVGEPTLTVTPTEILFGDQLQGGVSAPLVLTLTNTGNVPLEFGMAQLLTTSPEFQLENSDCPLRFVPNPGTVSPGASCTITIRFAPALTYVVGPRTAMIPLASNSGARDGNVYVTHSVPLSGNAVGEPMLAMAPSEIVFGDQLQGGVSAPLVLTLTNTGNVPLEFGMAQLLTTGPEFQLENSDCPLRFVPNPGTVSPGASCTITIRFAPALTYIVGPRTAVLPLASNTGARDGNVYVTHSVPLSGNAVGEPTLAVAPTELVFGEQVQGTTSAQQVVTLTNMGQLPLEFGFFGTTSTDFQVENIDCPLRFVPQPGTLSPATSCMLHVRFAPLVGGPPGQRFAVVNVPSNSGSTNGSVFGNRAISLAGIAVTPP